MSDTSQASENKMPPSSMQTSSCNNTKQVDFDPVGGGQNTSEPSENESPVSDCGQNKKRKYPFSENEEVSADLKERNRGVDIKSRIKLIRSDRPQENKTDNAKYIQRERTDDALEFIVPSSPKTMEFEILDDLEGQGSDDDDDDDDVGDEDDSDYDLDDNEIYAWLDEGLEKKKHKSGEKHDGSEIPLEMQKIILKERGADPFEVLPEGWVAITHNSGMPIYLHKSSRVCTLSKPYFLGPGSVREMLMQSIKCWDKEIQPDGHNVWELVMVCLLERAYKKHDIPLSAIPCLQYKRELQKERTAANEDINPESTSSADVILKSTANTEVNGSNLMNGDTGAGANFMKSISTENQSSRDQQITKIGENGLSGDQSQVESSVENEDRDKMAEARIESAEEKKKETSLDPDQVKEYCERLFEFRTITIKKFKSWKEKRRHLNEMKRQSRPALPSTTKLITCPIPAEKQDTRSSQKRKEFVLNPIGKSYLCILHEYTQHVLKVQPQYIFKELENAQTPYSATVVINNVEYGIGEGSSKKMAKLEAAKNTLKILLPVLIKVKEQQEEKQQDEDLSFFDEIKIEDPRVAELCNKAALPSPYQILLECLKRNCGMGDTSVQIDKKMLNNQKSEFTMKVGKHTASVTCRNKREGKQRVAQAMLRLLHPHISNWGSLLRLYGDSSTRGFKERKQIPEIQATTSSKTNNQVLENLKVQMRKLQMQKDAIKSKGKLRLENTAIPGSLAQIDLS